MNYIRWFGIGFGLFIVLIPLAWWSIGQYFYINWTQSAMISGIVIGSLMLFIERSSGPMNKKEDSEDE